MPRIGPPYQFVVLTSLLLSIGCVRTVQAQATYAVTEDGVRIWYQAMGEGVPIILIAGGPGGNSDPFRNTHTLLRGVGKVVLMDNRGRGLSDDPGNAPGTYTLENDVLDVEAVRTALHADKIVVFGHSYGSMVALRYASLHRDRTLALITSAGVPGAKAFQERNIDGVKRYLQSHDPPRWKQIVALHDRGMKTSDPELAAMLDLGEAYYYHDPSAEARILAQFDTPHDPKSVEWNPDVYRQMIGDDPEWTVSGSLAGVELLPALRNYKGPALILGGRHDCVCPPINQIEISQSLINARLVIFEHSGHNPHFEEPLRFLDVVMTFLETLPSEER